MHGKHLYTKVRTLSFTKSITACQKPAGVESGVEKENNKNIKKQNNKADEAPAMFFSLLPELAGHHKCVRLMERPPSLEIGNWCS